MSLLTDKQKTELIRNTVDEIMENLDNFYYDELLLKEKRKKLIKFLTENFKLLELWDANFVKNQFVIHLMLLKPLKCVVIVE